MNYPISEPERLSSWKVRLLERIQNLSADHARVLVRGHPDYQPHYGDGQIPIHTWHSHLRALVAERTEIEEHAAAVGISAVAIAEARAAGQRGLQWDDSVHAARTLRHGEDPERTAMIEQIAADVWQLEHMAAITVEHQLRGFDGRVPRDPAADAQFDANMVALWARADTTAHVAGLTGEEAAELWGRDPAGWQAVAVRVRGYDDAELHQRWRTYAWPGIEHNARRISEHLTAAEATTLTPPTPHVLIHHAAQAITAIDPTLMATTDRIRSAVQAALPPDPDRGWDSEPASQPDHRPPEPGPSTGHEL
ncbi:hypothetical protein ABZ540_33625 [Nocardia xishanensis]|uniref:hypothetical protein n=1 Tax=Nocardia xishanensis TaxID=238964 RepID=UPI0033FE91CA